MSTFSQAEEGARLLQPGRNCWRIERAQRMAMLVDAADYFRCVRAAICQAQHSVFILSWDIDSRIELVPGGASDGYPAPLGEFLHSVVRARPDLELYVLSWDFAMLYALEREWLPVYKLGWSTHRRLHFALDAKHPLGGSHHQKVVVVDDALAFVGGLDLTRSRWDTSEHAARQPLRRDPDGTPYSPFHDVQAMVDGDCARALGMLARSRWQRATGRAARPLSMGVSDLWPPFIEPDLTEIDVAISRTEPAYEKEPGVLEIKALHLDAIAAARSHLFFENQYFTAGLIADALGSRLKETDGPDVVVISPQTQSGWLEDSTMGLLRARMQRRLQAADAHGRYRLYCPQVPGLSSGCLNVHSKLFMVDDRLLSIGSANLSNRSMAADTECNLSVEAAGPPAARERIAQAIARMRARILAEHLGKEVEQVQDAISRQGLLAAIDGLRGGERTLNELQLTVSPELDALIPEKALFDPETPIDPEKLVAQFVPRESREPAPRRMMGIVLLVCALILLALAWRFTPLKEVVNLGSMINFAEKLDELPFTPVVVLACYVIGGLLMMPVTVLIAVTGIVFGPWLGGTYAVGGALLSAAVTYGVGAWLGRDTVRRMLGSRINGLSRRIAKRGLLAMMVIRVVPIAPYTIVNLVAGASHIRFRDFILGTLLGMLPGILLTVTFAHNLAQAVQRPSAGTLAVLTGVALLLVGFALLLQRLLARNAGAQ
jgi:phospholipase D1/2